MPYLYCEAYSQRKRYERVVEKALRGHEEAKRRTMKQQGNSRRLGSMYEPIMRETSQSREPNMPLSDSASFFGIPKLANLLERPNRPHTSPQMGPNGRVLAPNPLGQYLLDAARLFQGMAEYQEKTVIRETVRSETPLHLRRTLAQAYHWTLEGGEDYGKDQTLYRATKARAYHIYDPKTQTWPDHQLSQAGDCDKCRDDSRKVASIIMVDQLWMWILDSRTIITCFPGQYGRQRHESSDVDKSIRTRIQNTTSQLGSVFDLGLIIIDECSNTIFDRAKASGGRPEMVDVFSARIGTIVCYWYLIQRGQARDLSSQTSSETANKTCSRSFGSGPPT